MHKHIWGILGKEKEDQHTYRTAARFIPLDVSIPELV